MWALLQFISGSIAKNTSTDFIPVLKLFSLYDENYALPVPTGKSAIRKLSAAAIYVHLSRKMATQNGDTNKDLTNNQFQFTLPIALKAHYEYLQSLSKNEDFDVGKSLKEDYKVPLLCNTFSTAQDYFQVLISDLIKTIAGGKLHILWCAPFCTPSHSIMFLILRSFSCERFFLRSIGHFP